MLGVFVRGTYIEGIDMLFLENNNYLYVMPVLFSRVFTSFLSMLIPNYYKLTKTVFKYLFIWHIQLIKLCVFIIKT